MSVANFKPELWSALLVTILQERNDLRNLTRRDFEGEIRQMGDTVHINKFDGITVRDLLAVGTGDLTIDTISSTQVDLSIDQGDYFAMEVADVDQIQANIDLASPIVRDAAEKLIIEQNKHILTTLADAAPTAAPDHTIDAGAAIDLDDFKEARRLLSNQNVPLEDRWAVITPDMEGDLLGNNNIIQADQYGNQTPLVDGEIGRLLGFRIVVSTSVSLSGATPDQQRGVFFHRSALAWAQQKELRIEAVRREKGFGDLLKGFVLYGAVAVQPNAIVTVSRNA